MPNLTTAFRSHAMNTSQTMRSMMPTTASPRVGVLHTRMYTPPSAYAFASTSYRMLGLPWTRSTVFKTLHKAHKYPPRREGSSLIPFIYGAASARVFVPLLGALPSIFRRNSITTRSSNTLHLSRSRRYRQLRIPPGKHYKSKKGAPIELGQSNERVVCGSVTWLIITSLSFLRQDYLDVCITPRRQPKTQALVASGPPVCTVLSYDSSHFSISSFPPRSRRISAICLATPTGCSFVETMASNLAGTAPCSRCA